MEATTEIEDRAAAAGVLLTRGCVTCPYGPKWYRRFGMPAVSCRAVVSLPQFAANTFTDEVESLWPQSVVVQQPEYNPDSHLPNK